MSRIHSFVGALMLTAGLTLPLAAANAGSETGNFMVRVLGAGVLPDADATVTTDGTVGALGPAGVIAGGSADVSDELIPAATLTYFLNKNLAVELFCCFAKHQAEGTGAISTLGEIADFWIFPPALTLQYHFDNIGAFKPYVGAGVQYIHFFDEQSSYGDVSIDDAFGFTLQAGVDVSIGGGWYLNADVKKTWLDTTVEWADVGLTADLDVDPLIVSAGLGYRFNLEDLIGGRSSAPLK